nr:MAG TPA: dsDNA helicase [Caudoviricetes sp.]
MLKFLELNDEKQPVTNFDTTYTSLDKLDNAGLLLNNKVVVVDFDNDNDNESEIIDYFKQHYPTLTVETTRGIHFYYSKPSDVVIKNGADKITLGGFQVDYKTGTKSYAIVKHKGKMREANRELSLKDLPVLPLEMYPLPKAKNITGLAEGDGRNNALFYHLRLIREQKKDVDINNVANFINDVILGEKLETKELTTLVESVSNLEVNINGQYNGDPKDMIDFGEFIAKELDVKIYNGSLYFKDGLNYSRDKIKLNKAINKHLRLRRSQMTELEAQLYIYADLIDNKQKFNVKLRNGVIVEDNVVDFDCGFTPFYLDVSYDPTAYDKNVDEFINFVCCNRKDIRIVLEEILGHIILVNKFPHKIFFLTGSGANGKSTFVEMITKWTGELSSHVDIANFDDGTSLASLIGKVVNVADDVDAIYLEKSKNLKTMASGNTVGARAIYSQPITLKNTATLIFTANEPPVFKDKSDGIGRRLVIIPFENKVKTRIYNLDELLSTDNAKSYLLNLALAGVKRIYDNKLEMSTSETIEQATKQYYLDNDSVMAYLNDYPAIDNNPVAIVYEAYEEYCEDANLKAVSRSKFTRRLSSMGYTIKVIKMLGKATRVITKD